MAFCVECGAEGPILHGLCEKHFVQKHELVKAPETFRVSRCPHCSRLRLSRSWEAITLEDAIPALLAQHAVTDPLVKGAQFTWLAREVDPTTTALTVKARCLVGEWDLVTSFRTKVRVREALCPTGSRQSGDFFVGTVQVRADGRPLSEEEGRRVSEIATGARKGAEEFVSRIETVKGGVDVRVSSNGFAKRLARDLAKAFGGTVGGSATLHTQREGRELYRSTYVVRIPSFREGDTIRWRGAEYRVETLGDPVHLRRRDSGAIARVRVRDLRTASVGSEP